MSSATKAAGVVCLMVFLFSFGLFFSATTDTSMNLGGAPVFSRVPIPDVVPNSNQGHYSKMLKGFSHAATVDNVALPDTEVTSDDTHEIKVDPTEEVLSNSPFLSRLIQLKSSAAQQPKHISQNRATPNNTAVNEELDSALDLDADSAELPPSKSLSDQHSSLIE
eukprot:TRINITY_DN4566_c0_g2_i1.p1 TRINITY_DN4566_c0_g2~~TRINITY_DN4566_c0_g2_i1.p1  ORF type:complete len:165 (-),score=21.79 TRINITY_DN4566_c0_g2_i1:123-617(-)